MSLFLTWRCYNLHHSVRKITDHAMITFTLLPPFQYKTLTQSDQVTCLGALQVQTKSKCLEQWSKQELRSTVISDCPGPRELPPSPYVSLFVPRLVPLLGGQTSCRHKWGAGHAYASTSISTAPTHLSTPRPDFMEQIHITLREKYSNNICKSTH